MGRSLSSCDSRYKVMDGDISPIACISADLAADGLTEPLRFDH